MGVNISETRIARGLQNLTVSPNFHFSTYDYGTRGCLLSQRAFHSLQKAYKAFWGKKGFWWIFDRFFLKKTWVLPQMFEIFGSEMYLVVSQNEGCFFEKLFLWFIHTITITTLSKFHHRKWQAWYWEMHSKPKYRIWPQKFSWGFACHLLNLLGLFLPLT